MAPDFWSNSKEAEGIMIELKAHQKAVKKYETLNEHLEDLDVLYEFSKEGEASIEEVDAKYDQSLAFIESLEFRTTLNKPEDELNVTLEINAGAGGTEACDWAGMLFRMYTMWAEKNGHKVSVLNQQDGDVAGIKSVEMSISGEMIYGLMKGENGVHRLVRISPFNAQGKRMTSFASVFVHPVADDSIEIDINPSDIEWDTFRASGAGGQHVNKTESAVRVRHLPSGVVVECQQQRSQFQNRDTALTMLKSRLFEIELQKQLEEKDKVEADKMKNEWGSQIRSYVLDDRWVKDLRTGYKVNNPDKVLNGDLDGFFKAYLMREEDKHNAIPEN